MHSSSVAAPVTYTTRHPRLPVALLRPGLFVVDLDRPWLDTPFLLQGFLIESESEIAALREHCRHVHIDVQMSDPVVARALKSALEPDEDPPHAEPQPPPVTLQERPAIATPDAAQALRDADPLVHFDEGTLSLVEIEAAAPSAEPPTPPGAPARRPLGQQATPGLFPRGETPVDDAPLRFSAGAPRQEISPITRERFRDFVRQISHGWDEPISRGTLRALLGGLRRLIRGSASTEPPFIRRRLSSEASLQGQAERRNQDEARPQREGATMQALDQELDSQLPAGRKRTPYPVRKSVAEALPKAKRAWEDGAKVIEKLFADIRAGRGVQLVQVKEAVSDMVASMIDNPDAMLWVAHLRETDTNTYQHGVRSALYMIAVGRSLGFPKEMIDSLGLIGMLADIGKTRVPRSLLEKPGMLSPEEFAVVKGHVELGLQALETDGLSLGADVRAGILQHHERLDGSGYPAGLKGTDISIFGRIAGIADCFSALTTARPYANAMAVQDALMGLYQWSDTSFHAPLVEQFVQAVGVFPVGSLVELSNEEVAVVLAHNRSRRLEPRVIILTDAEKRPLAEPFERDLFTQAVVKGVKPIRIHRGLPAGAYGLKPHDFYADEALALAKAD